MRLRGIVRQNHRRVLQYPFYQREYQVPREGEVTHGVPELGFSTMTSSPVAALMTAARFRRCTGLTIPENDGRCCSRP